MRKKFGYLTLNLIGDVGYKITNQYDSLDEETKETIKYIVTKYLNHSKKVIDKMVYCDISLGDDSSSFVGQVLDRLSLNDCIFISATIYDSLSPVSGSGVSIIMDLGNISSLDDISEIVITCEVNQL